MADTFGAALNRLWPHGDEKVPGLRAGMIETAGSVFAKYGIVSPLLLAHVMAQVSHECMAGHEVVENLSYTTTRMMQVWPSRFPTFASAEPYAGNPRALADKVYNGRMGNVVGSDDGWNFRGRGGTQTTGRYGYTLLKQKTGIDVVNHPELLLDPKFFLELAVADFVICGCLPFAQHDDLVGVTKHLNGGTIGLDQRRMWLSMWKSPPVAVPPSGIIPRPPQPTVQVPPDPTRPDIPRPDPVPQVSPAQPPSGISRLIAAIASIFRRKA